MSVIIDGSIGHHCLRGGLLGSRLVVGVSGLWDDMVMNAGTPDCLREQENGASATTDHVHAIEAWLVRLSSTGFTLNCCCVSSDAVFTLRTMNCYSPAAAAKSLQSCPTLCNPIDGLLPGSPIPGSLQARTLEWVAISFSNTWKWKVKVKLLSCVRLLATSWTIAHQAPPSMGFSRQQCWSGVPSPSPRALHSSLGSSHLPKCMHFFQFLLLAGLNERLWKASVKYWYKHKPELACVTSIIGATLECKFANKKPINIRCG